MERTRRLYSLDALKFFATVLILFHHYQQCFPVKFSGIQFFGDEFYFGWLVELFFVLSGFFMGIKLKENSDMSFKNFLGGKLIRLYPMCMISTACSIVLAWMYRALFKEWQGGLAIGLWDALCGLLNIRGGVQPYRLFPNNPLWYVSVLVICYIVYWGAIYLSKRLRVNVWILFFAVMLCGFSIQTFGINKPLMQGQASRGYMCFFGGILLTSIFEMLTKDEKTKRKSLCFAWAILVCIFGLIIRSRLVWDNPVFILVFMIYPLVIYLLLYSRIFDFLFNRKAFGYLGKISFEAYIWHSVFYLFIICIERGLHITFPRTYFVMTIFAFVIYIWSCLMFPLENKLNNYLKGVLIEKIC